MTGVDPIRDLRFEGMDIPQLTDWIGKIKQGRGSESMNRAVQALDQCVQVVVDLDDTLRTELGKLGIAWEGNAGDLAQAAAQQRSVVMQQAQDPLRGSARSVEAQGRGFDSAKHSLPNSDELRHKQSENFFEWAGGAFGYESDYDAEAKQIDGRKKAAQAALGSYRDTTVTQAQQYQPLPQMPAPTVAASAGPPGAVPTVGAPGFGGDAVASGGGFLGAEQSTTGFLGGERSTSGGGRAGSDEPSAGGRSGTEDHRADSAEPGGNADPAPEGGDSGIGLGGVLGIGAGGAAVAGIGAVAAGRLLGGQGGAARGGGAAAEGRAATPGRGGSSGIGGGPGDTTAGRTAGSSPGSRPAAGSVMGPAATRGKKAAEDEEHENRYTAEETPFDDERLAAPPVLGGTGEPDGPEKQG